LGGIPSGGSLATDETTLLLEDPGTAPRGEVYVDDVALAYTDPDRPGSERGLRLAVAAWDVCGPPPQVLAIREATDTPVGSAAPVAAHDREGASHQVPEPLEHGHEVQVQDVQASTATADELAAAEVLRQVTHPPHRARWVRHGTSPARPIVVLFLVTDV
jgi:hypothetical protein